MARVTSLRRFLHLPLATAKLRLRVELKFGLKSLWASGTAGSWDLRYTVGVLFLCLHSSPHLAEHASGLEARSPWYV